MPGHWFGVADQELHVVGAPPRGTDIDSTGNHYCVAVEDLDQAIAELDEKQIPYQRAVQGAGTVQIWVIDRRGTPLSCSRIGAPPPQVEAQVDRPIQGAEP